MHGKSRGVITAFVALLFFFGCNFDSDQRKSLILFEKELVENYLNNKVNFSKIKYLLYKNNIKYLEYEDGSIIIKYTDAEAKWHTASGVADSKQMDESLLQAGIEVVDIKIIKNYMHKLNIKSVFLADNYDTVKGIEFKITDLQYKLPYNEMRYFYRIFDMPLDSLSSIYYDELVEGDQNKILDDHTIFYHKY